MSTTFVFLCLTAISVRYARLPKISLGFVECALIGWISLLSGCQQHWRKRKTISCRITDNLDVFVIVHWLVVIIYFRFVC